MTMPQVEVITSAERRRRWSRAEKERLIAACFEPGVTASQVARSAGIHASQLFRWRKELCSRSSADEQKLIPVEIVPSLAAPSQGSSSPPAPSGLQRRGGRKGIIEIELGDSRRIRVDKDVDAQALRLVLDALSGAR
jgi:transposase